MFVNIIFLLTSSAVGEFQMDLEKNGLKLDASFSVSSSLFFLREEEKGKNKLVVVQNRIQSKFTFQWPQNQFEMTKIVLLKILGVNKWTSLEYFLSIILFCCFFSPPSWNSLLLTILLTFATFFAQAINSFSLTLWNYWRFCGFCDLWS